MPQRPNFGIGLEDIFFNDQLQSEDSINQINNEDQTYNSNGMIDRGILPERLSDFSNQSTVSNESLRLSQENVPIFG